MTVQMYRYHQKGVKKVVQKVTQKGHFLTLFGSLFGPLLDTFGRSSLMIWTKKGVQKVTQKGHFLDHFGCHFGHPFGGCGPECVTIRPCIYRYRQKGGPKSDPKSVILGVPHIVAILQFPILSIVALLGGVVNYGVYVKSRSRGPEVATPGQNPGGS